MSAAYHEPRPGQWLEPEDFGLIIRLTPLVSIDLVVRSSEGLVLVGRRKHEPAKGEFFVPGGRITKNETREAAFRRITLEELGRELPFQNARLLGAYDHFYTTNRLGLRGFGTHYVVLAYEIVVPEDLEQLPAEQHAEYKWLTPEELLQASDVHENTKFYFRTALG